LHCEKENGKRPFNPLNYELNRICHLLALLGAHHIIHVSRIRINWRRIKKNNNSLRATEPLKQLASLPITKPDTIQGVRISIHLAKCILSSFMIHFQCFPPI